MPTLNKIYFTFLYYNFQNNFVHLSKLEYTSKTNKYKTKTQTVYWKYQVYTMMSSTQ